MKNAAGAAFFIGDAASATSFRRSEGVLLDRGLRRFLRLVTGRLGLGLVRLGLGLVFGLRRLAADGGLGVLGACLAVSEVALPASLTAVVAWAWAPAAPIRKAMAMSAFFMVSFIEFGNR